MPTYSDTAARQCVAFSTPGLIPLEAITTFGVNVKPNSSNPFGIFGTGLKYAISVCLREGCEVVLWRGKDKYTFYTRVADFRGKDFAFVRMKKETWHLSDFLKVKYEVLPFTLELGKTWELWQAFREFETNTRDENGSTAVTYIDKDFINGSDSTIIAVFGQKFVDEYHDRHRNFLPDGKIVRENEAIQVIDRPSKHIYYRGVRVMDLKVEAAQTYNFLCHVDLTEDRTAKHPFMLEMKLADLIAESQDEDLVSKTVGPSSRGRYESGLNYAYSSSRPSEVFVRVAPSSPNPTIKQKLVEAEEARSNTIITITVPKSPVLDEELDALQSSLEAIFMGIDVKVERA